MGFGFLHRFIKGKQKSVAAPRDAHHWQGLQQLEPRLLLSGSGYVDTQDHDDDTTDSLTILHSDFEAGWDGWTQETSDSFNWARISGQTVSSDTGPSSAADGNWYIYIESSSPNYPNKMASLVSPTLDLSGISDPSLSFDYHMYGSDIGQLSVQITTNGAVWEEVFSISGQQHPSSPSAWSQANINLDNYAGLPEVKLRFKGFTGDSYRGDISIDDVAIWGSAHSNSVPTGTVTITGMAGVALDYETIKVASVTLAEYQDLPYLKIYFEWDTDSNREARIGVNQLSFSSGNTINYGGTNWYYGASNVPIYLNNKLIPSGTYHGVNSVKDGLHYIAISGGASGFGQVNIDAYNRIKEYADGGTYAGQWDNQDLSYGLKLKAIEGEILTANNDLTDEDGLGGAWDSSSWGTVTMPTNNCTTRNLEITLTVSRATATIKASTSATSDTYVYLRDDAGQTHGTFAYHVSNYATLVKSKEFDPPIVVSEIKACSWWNAAKLEHLELEVSSITYQWNRDGQPITGATGKAYALVQDDVGSVITVVASYTDGKGTAESVTSPATDAVRKANSLPTGTVTIAGMEIEGEILTASSNFVDEDGFGIENPPEAARSYSSVWGDDPIGTGHARSMLDSPQAWSAKTNDHTTQWMDIDLGASKLVEGVVTQGREGYSQWVTTYKVSTSNDGVTFTVVDNDAVFSGNIDNYAKVDNQFSSPVWARYVRINPQAWNGHMSIRAGVQAAAITYQWNRDGQAITGATGKTYALVQDDVGSVITVVASYTDHNGTDESVISDATGIVTAVDTVPPTNNSISINGGNTYADSTSVTLTLASTGASQMRFKNESDGTYTSYESYATSKSWTLGSGDGTKTVYVQFKDTAGNTATAVSDAITLDSLAPVSNSISIDGGNAYTDSTSVTLTLASTGASQMRFKNESGSYTSWEPYATSKSWSLLDTQGTRTVSVQFKDTAGNTATAVSDAITLDSLAPVSNSISINGGNAYTDSTSVTLTLASTGASQMRFKNESGSYTSWEPYATSKPWSLLDTQGTRTVFVQFKDVAGNMATVVSDAITFDINDLPTGTVTIDGVPEEDQVLTASNDLADEDGLGSIIYQWHRDGVAIDGATSSTYTLTQENVGSQITVMASYTDGGGAAESVTSDATATVANVNDLPTGTVTIDGVAEEGQVLTASNDLADEDGLGLIVYQWHRDGVAIDGPTSSTYTLTQENVGSQITVMASYTDGGGTAESMTSDATATVANVNDLPTGTVTIDGVPEEDQTLTASNTLSDDDGLGPINYQWVRGDYLHGSITAWGDPGNGGSGAPVDGGYTQIVGNHSAFAALKEDGSITAWGDADRGGSGEPTDNGYTQIVGNNYAFAALKEDGSITAWGSSYEGGSGAPAGNGYTQIVSRNVAFAALRSDGSITQWGPSVSGSSGVPAGNGYTKIFSNNSAFAALKSDGSIAAWGGPITGGSGAPDGSGYTQIISNDSAFAALKSDGSIAAWGYSSHGGYGEPTDSGYTKIFSNNVAFAALKPDGSITAWGSSGGGGSGAPTGNGYTQVVGNYNAFAGLKEDGSITAWGNSSYGSSGAPTDRGYTQIVSTFSAFAAIKEDGSITAWGNSSTGGSGAPADNGYLLQVFSNTYAFAAIKVAPDVVATSSTYTPTQADVGTQITVTAIYTDGYGTPESFSSDPTVSVENVNDLPTGTVTIEGVVKEDQILTVAHNLADEDGLGLFSYQWRRDGLAIDGATSSTYTLMQDDVNSKTAVVMSYTDGYGSAESVTSDPIGPVYSNIPSQLTGHLVYPGVAVIVETQTVDLSGFTFVASALVVEASGTLTGYGSVSAPVSGNGTIELIGGNMSLGDLNDPSGFDFDGTLKLNGHTAVLQDSDVAGLGMTTALGNGGTLIATNDLVLGEGRQINGSGEIISRTLDNQGSIHVIGGSLIIRGNLSGSGDFPENGEVVILGDYQPGNSPAVIDFGGDVAFGSSANLVLEINGAEPGSGYDQLNIAGDLGAGGTLEIVLGEGYAPVGGESFNLLNFGSISGVFSQVTFSGQPLNDGLLWDDSRLYSDGSVSVTSQALPPVITLVGDANMTLEASRTGHYMDLGATCTSNVDGNLNHAVEVSGQIVDMRVPGTYTIQYNCTDLTGQSAQPATRNIEVKDTMPPVITLSLEDIVIHVGDNTHTGLGGETNINESQPQPTSENAVGKAFRLVSPIYRQHDLSYTQPDGSAVKSRQDWTMKLAANSIEVILPVATAWDRVDDSVEVTVTIYLVDLDGDGQTSVQSQVDLTRRSTYLFKYDVQDQSGNHAEQVVFALILNDLESPSISLAGGLTQVVEAGSDWELGQSTAHDNMDGDLTDQIRYAVHDVATQAELGSDLSYADAAALVDTMTLGKFLVTVVVSDAAGIYGTNSVNNTAQKYQAVEVRDTMPPVIIALPVLELDEDDTIHMTGPDLAAYASDQYALPSNLEFRIVNFSDIDSEFGLTIGMDLSSGSFASRTDTTLHVHPSPDFSGTTTVSIEARDSSGNVSNLQSFVLAITPVVDLVPGDANQDGVVDIADLGIVGANFNKTSVEWSQGDFNGDEKVDIADLGIIGANWTAADSAVILYATSNPRTSMLHAQGESGRSNRLDLATLLQQDDQNELAHILPRGSFNPAITGIWGSEPIVKVLSRK